MRESRSLRKGASGGRLTIARRFNAGYKHYDDEPRPGGTAETAAGARSDGTAEAVSLQNHPFAGLLTTRTKSASMP